MWLNWGCGMFRAPEPWVNVDVVRTARIQPDVIVDDEPWPWLPATVERIYAGHVLEHVAWHQAPDLVRDLAGLLTPDGEMMVVGPDVLRTIDRYHSGLESREQVLLALEDDRDFQWVITGESSMWDGARHHWNCYEERLVRLLQSCGLKAEAVPVDEVELLGWPVVSFALHQCAVRARLG